MVQTEFSGFFTGRSYNEDSLTSFVSSLLTDGFVITSYSIHYTKLYETTLVEGTGYTITNDNGFFTEDKFATAETGALTVTYTYVEKVLGGASEMALADSFDSEEKAMDSSFRKITRNNFV